MGDFHFALQKIEKATGADLQEFRIPQEDLRRGITGGNYLTGEVDYSGRMVVERTRLLLKVDAVLSLLPIPVKRQSYKGSNGIQQGLSCLFVPDHKIHYRLCHKPYVAGFTYQARGDAINQRLTLTFCNAKRN